MSGAATSDHRQFAIEAFNSAWDQIDAAERSADDDLEMLLTAAASRWHWGKAGGTEQLATGDWQVAHVASLIGIPELALRFADRSLRVAIASGWDGWQLASAHEGMARAMTAAGDAAGRAVHLALADEALGREPSAEDATVIRDQLASIPDLS